MKSKQIVDLGTAISNDSNVQLNTTARHSHDETLNVVPVSDGAGNYDDSQIGDDGTTVTIGSDASVDTNHLMWIAKDITNTMKLEQIKSDGDSFLLTLDADQTNTGKNYGLKITANGSINQNIAMAIDSGKAIIGALSGDDSALLEISSTTSGVLIPRMNTTEMNAISSPANGLMIYNTTANDLMINIGDGVSPNWIGLKAVGITGSGVVGTIPRFATSTSIENSQITDDGTTIAIGTTHDPNIFIHAFTMIATGIKMMVAKTTGTVMAIFGQADGNANQNIGVFGTCENGDVNNGVIGASGTNNTITILNSVNEKNIGVRGFSRGNETEKTIGVVGEGRGNSDINIGVLGYVENESTIYDRAILGIGGAGFKDFSDTIVGDESSAVLYAKSTTRGFLTPKMTTAQKNAIVSPANGLIVFDVDSNDLQINTGDDVTPTWTSLGSTGITGTLSLDSIPRATGTNTIADGSINDNGSNVSIGTTPQNDVLLRLNTSEIYGFYVSQVATTGVATCGTFITNGSNTNDNIGLNVQTTNPGSGNAIVLRLDNGVDNTGKFLQIQNSNGDVDFVTLTAITSGGTNTQNYLSKFNASGQLIDSLIYDDGSSVQFKDSEFLIKDETDGTKQIKFEANSIASGTVRTITMPNRNISLIGANGTNTTNTIQKIDGNGDLTDSLISENLNLVSVNGNITADQITTTTQFVAPTSHGNTTTSNNFEFDCDSGMTQSLDLQGQTGNGTLSIVNMADGNTYSLMVIQGSGTYDLTLPSGYWLNDTTPFDFTALADNDRALITMTYINNEWLFAVKKLTYQA